MCSLLVKPQFVHFSLKKLMSTIASTLIYHKYGEPYDVVEIIDNEIENPRHNEVLVKVLMAPINPADINTIQGKYPVKVEFPSKAGNEFVGKVLSTGESVQSIKPDDYVISNVTGLGTWTTHIKENEEKFLKLPYKIGLVEAATLAVNPCTAYRMLKDFVNLTKDDVIIQNGANSAVGQAIHQLCKAWDIKSIGIVRNRPNIEKLRNYLKSLGATEILTEEELRRTDIFNTKYKKPILGFNCVGGKSINEISRHLNKGGCLVTYGGMSKEPVIISTSALIFKDLQLKGFWMTRWSNDSSNRCIRFNMINDICELIKAEKFIAPAHEIIEFHNYKKVLESMGKSQGFSDKKYILDFGSLKTKNN